MSALFGADKLRVREGSDERDATDDVADERRRHKAVERAAQAQLTRRDEIEAIDRSRDHVREMSDADHIRQEHHDPRNAPSLRTAAAIP